MRKKYFLAEVSQIATDLGNKETGIYKHGVEVTPAVSESVLHATSDVIQRELINGDAKATIQVPHFGTFRNSVRQGKEDAIMRNPRTGETFTKSTQDKHSIKFSATKQIAESYNEAKLKQK